MAITYKAIINELFRDLQHLPTPIKTDIDYFGYDFCIAKQLDETNKLFKVKDSSPLIIVYKDENNTMTNIKTGETLYNIQIELLGTDFDNEYFNEETYRMKETQLKSKQEGEEEKRKEREKKFAEHRKKATQANNKLGGKKSRTKKKKSLRRRIITKKTKRKRKRATKRRRV